MFNNWFGKKNKKEQPDVTNLSVRNLNVGAVFEYDMNSWVVKEAYQYDWGNNNYSAEYKISNGSKTYFLGVDTDDELEITLTEKVKIRLLGEDIPNIIKEKEEPPANITYKGIKYILDSEASGYFRNKSSQLEEDWAELISWDYSDEAEERYLNIEQWGDNEFEASVGYYLDEHEISNILPGK